MRFVSDFPDFPSYDSYYSYWKVLVRLGISRSGLLRSCRILGIYRPIPKVPTLYVYMYLEEKEGISWVLGR